MQKVLLSIWYSGHCGVTEYVEGFNIPQDLAAATFAQALWHLLVRFIYAVSRLTTIFRDVHQIRRGEYKEEESHYPLGLCGARQSIVKVLNT
jgi:hypothetical protein